MPAAPGLTWLQASLLSPLRNARQGHVACVHALSVPWYYPLVGHQGDLLLTLYGGRPRGTRLLEDQLGRADAGSWQIADRYYMAS